MNRRALKQWLYDRLVESATIAPVSYPYSGAAGVLYRAGYNTSNLRIYKDRPVNGVDVQTRPTICLNIPRENGKSRTVNGPAGSFIEANRVELDVLWLADMTGTPNATPPIAPLFATQEAAQTEFDNLVMALKLTLQLSVTEKTGPTQPLPWKFSLVDPVIGYTSKLLGMETEIDAGYQEASTIDNEADLFYGAVLTCHYLEDYTPISQPGV